MTRRQFSILAAVILVSGAIGMTMDLVFHVQAAMLYWALGSFTGALAVLGGTS